MKLLLDQNLSHRLLDKLLTNREAIEQAHKDPDIWCVEIY